MTTQLDNTDELPVLSEEAISRHRDAATASELARLARELAALRRTVERIEQCWQSLAARFEAQRETLQRLISRLDASSGGGDAVRPPSRSGRWRRGRRQR